MPNDTRKAVAELLAPMLKKTLFVAINHVAAPASAIEPFVAEHLAYMNALEAEGRLWASGPFIPEGVLVGDGLTILSTSTIEGARRAMEEERSSSEGCAATSSENGSCAKAAWMSRCVRRSAGIHFDADPSHRAFERKNSFALIAARCNCQWKIHFIIDMTVWT
jgi:uncharacterized protein YciI